MSYEITYRDIEDLTDQPGYHGYGYLGHIFRRHAHDVALAEAVNITGYSLDDVFLWANSRPARHVMDGIRHYARGDDHGKLVELFTEELADWVPILAKEA